MYYKYILLGNYSSTQAGFAMNHLMPFLDGKRTFLVFSCPGFYPGHFYESEEGRQI